MSQQPRWCLELNHLSAHRINGQAQPRFPEQFRAPRPRGDHHLTGVVFAGRRPDSPDNATFGNYTGDSGILQNGNSLLKSVKRFSNTIKIWITYLLQA